MDQIRLANSRLADEFAAVNRDLEKLTLAYPPNDGVRSGDDDVESMDPFGQLVVQQRKLLDDREKLVSQIQALPGLDTFLKPPSFDTLRSAACRGPVIVINHSKWRCDILILLHNTLYPLLFPHPTTSMNAQTICKINYWRNERRGSSRIDMRTLRSVLEELYELVGRPVIKRLNKLHVPEQSRIWWCPTSVYCSFPLHAMVQSHQMSTPHNIF